MAEDSELITNINFFVKSHCELIDAELEEEKKQYKYDTGRPEIGNLEKKGVLINDLSINNVRREFGTCIVEFSKSTSRRHCSGPLLVSSGDIASVWYHDEEAENKKTFLASGTVMLVADIVKMSFDNSDPFHWDHEQKYFILKALSEVTFKRMKNALENLVHHANGRCSMIIKHLFGFTSLESTLLHPKFLTETRELKFYNSQLKPSQKDAVRFCLEQNNFAVVHGPPGTGKTTVLIEIILQLVYTGHKVLVCAPSNIAVDTIVEKLDVIKSRIIRIGKTARMLDKIKLSSLGAAMSLSDDAPILKDVKDELEKRQRELGRARPAAKQFLRQEIKVLKKEYYMRQYRALQDLLRGASVVLSTLISASDDGDLKNLPLEHFDVLIIDECSQAIEASCWIAIPRAPKLIVAGDHLQLPPTIKSQLALDCGLGVSLMERAILRMGGECYKLLTQQYRMNLYIMQWVSTFYNNSLTAEDEVSQRLLKHLPDVKETEETDTPLLLVDTAGLDQLEKELHGSKCNESEANVVAVLIKRLVDAGVSEKYIAVITPYSLQVSCIKTRIRNYQNVEVRTVDGFQGREKEAVIISLVRSNRRRDLGFVSDKRRLNVAVSRAQCFLAIVGDSTTLRKDATINGLLRHIEVNGLCYSAHEFTEEVNAQNFPVFTPQRPEIHRYRSRRGNANNQSRNKKEAGPSTSQPSTSDASGVNKGKSQTKFKVEDLQQAFKNISVPSSSRDQGDRGDTRKPFSAIKVLDVGESSDSENSENVPCTSSSLTPDVKEESKGAVNKKSSKPQSKTSKTKMDDDSLESDEDLRAIEESNLRNTTCFMKGCKASVKLYPQLCQHCNEVFCLAHMLPEVHGCGDAAKRSARHTFRHEPRQKSTDKDKKIASKKLKEKVSQMASDRKRQAKK